MLGEVGDRLEEGPYLLEPMVDQWDELKHVVRMELLGAAMKMFFKRPPECQKMLGKLLAKATADPSHVDVHDKALLYYRLLEYDPEEAQRIVCGDPNSKTRITTFTEDAETEVKDQIFEEFNSMSVIYGQPAHKFVTDKELASPGAGDDDDSDGADAADSDEDEESDESDEDLTPQSAPGAQRQQLAAKDSSASGSDDDSDDSDSDSSDDEEMVFRPSHSFGKQVAQVFERNWMDTSSQEAVALRLQKATSSDKDIDKKLKKAGLHMMATGNNAGSIRAYYIGERQDKAGIFMAELIINLSSRQVNATLKTDDQSSLGAFKSFFSQALSGL
jgi:hypothetical protein